MLLSLSLILITLGLFRNEHTELALIGFVFLFLLSFLLINNDIQYRVGYDTNTTYTYTDGNLSLTEETTRDVYTTSTMGGSLSHSFGYWLAVISIVGFIGMILALKKEKW